MKDLCSFYNIKNGLDLFEARRRKELGAGQVRTTQKAGKREIKEKVTIKPVEK